MPDAAPGTPAHHSARVEGVDVIRGLAALTVLVSHYIPHWDQYYGAYLGFVSNAVGYYAVEVFFVISGLVIYNTLERCRNVRHFVWLRFSRLYPALWFVLVITVLLMYLVGKPVWLLGIAANATMFQEFLGVGHLDNVFWSLSVELAFYAQAACLFALGWHTRVTAVAWVWLLASCVWSVVADPGADTSRDVFALYFALDYAAFFVIGMTLHKISRQDAGAQLYLLLAAAHLTAYLVEGVTGFCVALTATVSVWGALHGYLNLLVNSATLWLGKISFSLYLLHRNFGYELLREFHELGLGPTLSIVLTSLLALGLAAAVTFAVELPAMRLLRKLDQKWTGQRGKRTDHPGA